MKSIGVFGCNKGSLWDFDENEWNGGRKSRKRQRTSHRRPKIKPQMTKWKQNNHHGPLFDRVAFAITLVGLIVAIGVVVAPPSRVDAVRRILALLLVIGALDFCGTGRSKMRKMSFYKNTLRRFRWLHFWLGLKNMDTEKIPEPYPDSESPTKACPPI